MGDVQDSRQERFYCEGDFLLLTLKVEGPHGKDGQWLLRAKSCLAKTSK